jgi:hypothetical protein
MELMTATSTTTPHAPTAGTTVQRFLEAVCAGSGIPTDLYRADATLDATVPNWRFSLHGATAIAEEYGRWFGAPGTLEELQRTVVPGGEVVRYLLAWSEHGVPHAAHHCHLLRLDGDGRIASDVVFCGGRWDAALLARMGEAAG